MEPQAITNSLGPKQQEAATGPIDQIEPEMLTYECKSCSGRFVDLGLYFYGVNSTKCIWCSKFPKAKNVRTIKTISD